MGKSVREVEFRLRLAVGHHESYRFTRTHSQNSVKAPIVTTTD